MIENSAENRQVCVLNCVLKYENGLNTEEKRDLTVHSAPLNDDI